MVFQVVAVVECFAGRPFSEEPTRSEHQTRRVFTILGQYSRVADNEQMWILDFNVILMIAVIVFGFFREHWYIMISVLLFEHGIISYN